MGNTRSPTVSIEPSDFGVRIAMESESHALEREVSYPDALKLFLQLGAAIARVNEAERKNGVIVSKQSALTLQTGQGTVSTQGGNAMFVVEVQNFPTLRLPISDTALRTLAQAMIAIADTPPDQRNARAH